MIFEVSSLQKCTQNQCQNAVDKSIAKKSPRIDFGIHFRSPKTPKFIPKSFKIAPQSDARRSLFRDAMRTVRKSSEGSGPQSFGTVSLVFQRIRSALSVSLSLCLSVDLLLVALIIKLSLSTLNASCTLILPKSSKHLPQILPKSL